MGMTLYGQLFLSLFSHPCSKNSFTSWTLVKASEARRTLHMTLCFYTEYHRAAAEPPLGAPVPVLAPLPKNVCFTRWDTEQLHAEHPRHSGWCGFWKLRAFPTTGWGVLFQRLACWSNPPGFSGGCKKSSPLNYSVPFFQKGQNISKRKTVKNYYPRQRTVVFPL